MHSNEAVGREIGHDQFRHLAAGEGGCGVGPLEYFENARANAPPLSLRRIPRRLLRTWEQLRLLPPRTSILSGSVSGRVALHPGLRPGSHRGIGPPPLGRPKVHGHDLPRRDAQPRPGFTGLAAARPRGRLRGRPQSSLLLGQQLQLQRSHVPPRPGDGRDHRLVKDDKKKRALEERRGS